MKKIDNKQKLIKLFENLNGIQISDAQLVGQPRPTIFDITNVQQLTDLLNNGLQVPVKKAGFSTLGGKENVRVMLLVAFDPKENWPHGILENSHYARFHIDRDGTIEMFSGGKIKNRFRKTRAKSIDDILNKINAWINIEGAQVTNERIGYTAEPQNQNPFANTQLANTMPVGDNEPTTKKEDGFDPTAPVFAPVIPESTKPTPITKKEVRYLSVGDILSGTGGKVISAPISGLKTPPGKMEVVIEYPNGRKILKIWGKYTVVGVRPAVDMENEIPLTESESPELQFKPKEGFWDVTKYVYGGHFDRFMGGETGKLIPGTVKKGDEIRVKLSDGRTVVCSARAVANVDFDTVLDLAKSNGRQIV